MAGEFEELYQHLGRLVGQLFLVTGDLHEAEEVVEAFTRAAGRLASAARVRPAGAVGRRVAINLATDGRRRRRRLAVLAQLKADQAAVVPPISVDGLAVAAALATLPRRQRQVVVLHYLLDVPVQEVARQLSMPVGTVKSRRLARARARLPRSLMSRSRGRGVARIGPGPVGGTGRGGRRARPASRCRRDGLAGSPPPSPPGRESGRCGLFSVMVIGLLLNPLGRGFPDADTPRVWTASTPTTTRSPGSPGSHPTIRWSPRGWLPVRECVSSEGCEPAACGDLDRPAHRTSAPIKWALLDAADGAPHGQGRHLRPHSALRHE